MFIQWNRADVKLLDIIDRSNAKFTIFCNSKAVDNKPQVNEG
jgi:peptidoglycan/xylan/chitin deacetylase (PgdA/CDA1 family)